MRLQYKVFFIGIISYILISANIGGYSIYILDEAKNAGCAMEMMQSEDFVTPTFNGELRKDKPPLHYYFMMAGYGLFGITPFAARFFSVLFGVLTVMITYLTTRRFLNERTADFTFLSLISSFGFITQFHLATPDPYLICFTTTSLICFFYFDQTNKTTYVYLAYLSVGLGLLTKGPIAIALPGLTILTYLLVKKKMTLSYMRSLKPIIGVLIILGVALPWYVMVHIRTAGEWTEGFFLEHNIHRFTEEMEGHGGGFWVPTLYLIGFSMPFIVFVPSLSRLVLKHGADDMTAFCAVAVVMILLFFSFSETKLPNYIAPAMPFLAILLGRALHAMTRKKEPLKLIGLIVYILVGSACLIAAVVLSNKKYVVIEERGLQWILLPIALAGMVALIFYFFKRINGMLIALSFGFIIFHQLFHHIAYPIIDDYNPVQKSLSLIQNSQSVIGYKSVNPAYVFALKKPIPEANSINELTKMLHDTSGAFLISHPKYENEITTLPKLELVAEYQDLFDVHHVVIYRYRDSTGLP